MNKKRRVFVPKAWGWEDFITNNEKYCGKLLFIKKDHWLSWHYHCLKTETFFLHSGKLLIKSGWGDDILAAENTIMEPGDTFEVPIGLRHRMIALLDSELFEFSTTHYDSDSYRIIPSDE